jgi:peptidoglycan/xylan/chitin deacetylase (PgdA/CDA1 family)
MIGERLARAVFRAARGVAQAGIASRPAMTCARMFGVRKATIFMLHRFTEGASGDLGTDVSMLRNMLAMLRKQGVQFMRLRELAAHVEARTDLTRPTAVFTVDDGYQDFAQLAAPIFQGFDCVPTVFLVTEFVNGRQWCWWDRVTEAFLRSPLRAVTLSCDGRTFSYLLGSAVERRTNANAFIEELKWIPDNERLRIVARIGALLGVDLPDTPTPEYSPLSWDDVRRLEREGVDFGPHTLTHPVLSRVSPEKSRDEILQSWADVRRECADPSPVFCYPNGSLESFGPREINIVRESGMTGAVAFRRRYVDPRTCSVEDRYCLSRFPAPPDLASAGYLASGLAWEG